MITLLIEPLSLKGEIRNELNQIVDVVLKIRNTTITRIK
jgi:hypothetical protein